MGNNISYSSDDEFLRVAMNLQKNELRKDLLNDLKSNSFFNGSFEISGLDLLLIKIKVNDLDKFLSLKSFNDSLKLLGNMVNRSSEINFFGFGLEKQSEKLSSFFADYEEDFVFKKEKQIKHISKAINRLFALEEPFFYYFSESVPLTNLERIPKSVEIKKSFYRTKDIIGPYLLVNIKGGVGYYHIDENTIFKRVGGSIIGESAFKALSQLMTDYTNSEEAFKAGISGDNVNIDMTVEDIYGDKLTNLGLSKDIIASSFGKAVADKRKLAYNQKDLVRSLITMIAINVGQMSWLYSEIERLKNIIVVGSKFVGEEFYFMFQSVLNAYSKFGKKIIFVENADFLATISPLTKNQG